MDAFQKVTREILDRIRGLRVDDEGWKTAKQTVRFSLLRIVVNNNKVIKGQKCLYDTFDINNWPWLHLISHAVKTNIDKLA